MNNISLNGSWRLTGTGPAGETKTLTATVPGQVHVDLEREGLIPPMFWRDNADDCQWVEHWHWTYEKDFELPAGAPPDTAELDFEGLDTFATVYVNGVEIGKAEDMFLAYRFDCGDLLHEGTNTVTVKFDTTEEHTEGLPELGGAFYTDRGYVRRMQCTFYWDWVERLVSYGIWRPVTLHFKKAARIETLSVLTRDIVPTSASLDAVIETSYEKDYLCREQLEIFDPDGALVWKDWFEVWAPTITMQVDLRDPRLWWPNGYGEQPIYTARLTLLTPEGEVIETRERTFGIRTVRVEQLQDQPGSPEEAASNKKKEISKNGDWIHEFERSGMSFTVLVNGSRIFCTGGNWVPADPFPSRITAERYQTVIGLAGEAGMTMLRSWGGGIYEPEEFFDACDRTGILITQDFIFACMPYPKNEVFYDLVRREVTEQVKRLRSHPSLAWWTGDNEVSMGDAWDARGSMDRVRTCEVIEPIVRALDPTRPYFPTSPWNGNSNLDNTKGDSHSSPWGKWDENGDVREYYRLPTRFESEHIVAGIGPRHSLLKFMNEADFSDPENRIFEFHDKSFKGANPTLFQSLERYTKLLLGEYKNTDDRLLKLAFAQYEPVRLAIESRRRARWYNSGILFWMYNDCWPAVGWSLVGYDLIPKAGWYAAKRANRPIIASIADTEDHKTFTFHVLNNGICSASGTLTVSVVSGTERREILKKEFVSVAGENTLVATTEKFSLSDHEILIAELSGEVEDTAVYYPNQRITASDFGTAHVSYTVDPTAQTITFATDMPAIGVAVEGDLILSDNYFNLYPGKQKTVSYRTVDGFPLADAELYCLNGSVTEG